MREKLTVVGMVKHSTLLPVGGEGKSKRIEMITGRNQQEV
jgi:hypothetical protein